ncbi:NAD(P)/FAD-dependent oxidoreductase [Nocardia bhagyanarayanae]|uniref:NADH dehydrogenase FAD-containing subunit n=1 Tax=Nocardia bhagyanarayanae TaxID=1215925 RepID=A0A543F8C7_9NOCA|nr:FAD-dependent oxidoreductase [Nocardia bhagyanarayanae]TQM30088.1 NADH dehydrogenase FAD-containing subunit [Nocardia bhagyanarayanae]
MTGNQHIVVLGAGYAGLAAAKRLAGRAGDARVTVVDARAEFVERVRLHQQVAGQRIRRWDLAELLQRKGIRFVQARATDIDTVGKRVELDRGAAIDYDVLIYALGSLADPVGVPGAGEFARTVATPEDSTWTAGGTVAVVGAGATGIELAAELAESQPDSRVLLLGPDEPGAWLSATAVAHIRKVLERLGVEIRADAKVVEVTADGVRLANGEFVAADTTVWTTGFGVPDLAARAGLAVDGAGRVLTDESLRSLSHPDIYAAGDSAVVAGPGGRSLRMACATALPTGKYAADVVAARMRGQDPRDLRFRYVFQCIGLGRRDAVIQFLRADDTPARTVLRGRFGAGVKELVVRGAAAGAGLR